MFRYSTVCYETCHSHFMLFTTISRGSVRMLINSKTAYLKAQTPLTLYFFYYDTEYNVKAGIFIFALLLNIFSVVLSSLQQHTSYPEVMLVTLLRHCVKLRNLSNMKLPRLKVLLSRIRISADKPAAETERSCAPVICNRLECSNLEMARPLVLTCRRLPWKKQDSI